jgi:hypothetical protein
MVNWGLQLFTCVREVHLQQLTAHGELGLKLFMFVSEVQLQQPTAHCEVRFTLVRVFDRVLLPWAPHLLQTPCVATPVFVPPSCITCCVTYNALWTIIAGFLPACN